MGAPNSRVAIHEDRRRDGADSAWVRQFDCRDVRPLIVCRGPIRKETMDVLEEMGIDGYGILLSEKDSIVYTRALAPELRHLTDPDRIHRVPDYSGNTKEERVQRIEQIIAIAHGNGYDSVFAGYGFMAEDEGFVAAIEKAGLRFIGPSSHTVRAAGRKDEAKKTALGVGVSVTPGVNNVAARALLRAHPDRDALMALVEKHDLELDMLQAADKAIDPEVLAESVLEAGWAAHLDLVDIAAIAEQVRLEVKQIFAEWPGRRLRLKAVGGGGGKGQRILAAPAAPADEAALEAAAEMVPKYVREILNEVKATGVGDNKNLLIELNIEQTRHQEIQLVGNGQWCLSLGARDCSVQMHEQKLLEISQTREGLEGSIARAEADGRASVVAALKNDLEILGRMEAEAERFGSAVGLDSVSTFECIVDRDRHYFMEVNTRIQVEHRVTELCYALRFTNPDDPEDSFRVTSLVEVMVLLARHGDRLPEPTREPREPAAVEARLNATNAALKPHAGGLITYWSTPLEGEIRDDQGISLVNPDTDRFMYYKIAGAYDSNIALLVTHGEDRPAAMTRLAEILRRTKLKGNDLDTNLAFHYGLVCWLLGHNVYAKTTTRFVVPYLTQVGLLAEQAGQLDLELVFAELHRRHLSAAHDGENGADTDRVSATAAALDRKKTLLLRPLRMLLSDPHLLAGWLGFFRDRYVLDDRGVAWSTNPVMVLRDTYHYLNMDYREDAPAAEVIWAHDHRLLMSMLSFYEVLAERTGLTSFSDQSAALAVSLPPKGFSSDTWRAARAAHAGFQLGLGLLGVLPLIGSETRFEELGVGEDLEIEIPDRLFDSGLQSRMARVLVPPPPTRADEITAVCGGMYYAREAPGHEPFVSVGDRFEEGDPLYIIEVMKMFNTVHAAFAGTVDKILVETDGTIVTKGQPLLEVTPLEPVEVEDPKAIAERRGETSRAYAARLV